MTITGQVLDDQGVEVFSFTIPDVPASELLGSHGTPGIYSVVNAIRARMTA